MYDELLEQLKVLDKFNKGKVSITLNFGNSCITYTYMNFSWDEDAGYLVMGDNDTIHEDATSIDFDDILEVDEMNDDLVELTLENGKVVIILDTEYSLCFKCGEKRPVFYMRAYGENSEEYDIRVCQDCFNKMIEC
jgi:hypothetical protein